MLNPDFRDMLLAFEDAEVEYLVVGAYVLAAHGIPRATGDLDLWVKATQENAKRVLLALSKFWAPSESLTMEELATENLEFQIGISPRRIDILTSITGVSFEDASQRPLNVELDGIQVRVLGLVDDAHAAAPELGDDFVVG